MSAAFQKVQKPIKNFIFYFLSFSFFSLVSYSALTLLSFTLLTRLVIQQTGSSQSDFSSRNRYEAIAEREMQGFISSLASDFTLIAHSLGYRQQW